MRKKTIIVCSAIAAILAMAFGGCGYNDNVYRPNDTIRPTNTSRPYVTANPVPSMRPTTPADMAPNGAPPVSVTVV